MGGRLAQISSADDNAAIVALMAGNANVDKVWIGLNDRQVEGSFRWVREADGVSQIPWQTGDYENWGTGEPSSSTAGKDCVHVLQSSALWFARSCDQVKPSVCMGIAPPPSPPQPPANPPPDSDFSCFGAEQTNTMIAANAISQHSTDSAALDACIAAGAGVCGGVAYNPGVAANIQWSARQTGSTFTMNGVSFWAFTGCRRARARKLLSADNYESDPAYQASLPSDAWWKDAYSAWAQANAAPALPPYNNERRLATNDLIDEADLSEQALSDVAPDLFDDHRGPWTNPTTVKKKPRAGPLWGMFAGMVNRNDRL